MARLHNYVWIDASRSFNQALRPDPQLAFAHVGLFRVFINLNDLPTAAEEVRKAQSLQSTISERERCRIEVTAKPDGGALTSSSGSRGTKHFINSTSQDLV